MLHISSEILYELIDDDSTCIIDTRSNNAFIGWRTDGSIQRGHIPGAVEFSAQWLLFLDKAVLSKSEIQHKEKLLEERLKLLNLQDKEKIILYDSNEKDSKVIAEYLKHLGIQNLYYYNINNWKKDLEIYPNFQDLVPPEWVNEVINGNAPNFYDGKGYKIFECSWGKENITFLGSHIPGAVHIDTDEIEKEPEWIRKDDSQLIEFLKNNGIDYETTIILYSNGSECAEFKVALILKYLGHPKVKVLNGGYSSWRINDFPTERGSVKKQPIESTKPLQINVNKDIIYDMPEAKKILNKTIAGYLIDGRPWEEYSGEVSGYKYIYRTGRIPGSIWGGSYIDYKNIDDTIRSYNEIKAIWEKHNIKDNQILAYFCGSAGWGAAMIQFYGHVLNNYSIKTFEGGWNEWQLDESNPTDVGLLKKKEG